MCRLLISMIMVATAAGIAAAGSLAPTKPSQVVQLLSGANDPGCTTVALKTRENPDGTTSNFSIPPGQVLVVTNFMLKMNPDPREHGQLK
jgi:hypothetical protein